MGFSALLGQAKALALLDRALSSGRLAHAYLFAGPDGVGKTTVALELAATLLCTGTPPSQPPCGHCPGCVKWQSGNHPDCIRIRPDGAGIKIDQIRELKQALRFAPFEAQQRIVLLEEVHTMRREAGNSLLKVLEEPPPGNLLILLGANLGLILETIVSRCQVIPFAPLPLDLAAQVIGRHRPQLEAADCAAMAALADGCPGQALALEADGLLALLRQILAALVSASAHMAARVELALSMAADLAETKENLEALLRLLRIFFKDLMAEQSGAPARTAWRAEGNRARERWNLPQLSAKMATIDLAAQAVARNCNRALVCEVLLLDLFDCNTPESLMHP